MTIEKNFIPNQGERSDPEIKGLIEALFSGDNTPQKTVLNPRQVIVLARAHAFSDMYTIPELKVLCDYLMQLKISENGRGRKDLIAALQTRRQFGDENDIANQRRRLLGGRNNPL